MGGEKRRVSKYLDLIATSSSAPSSSRAQDDPAANPIIEAPAEAAELIRTCREYGVGLKLDPDGTLVIVSNGNAWRALVNAIEAHVDEVTALVAAGWNGLDA